MMALLLAVLFAYGYVIVLSWWAMRVQRRAAALSHSYAGHGAMHHVAERGLHGAVAQVVFVSLIIRLVQLDGALTPWLLVPLTVAAAVITVLILLPVWVMAKEDLRNWGISGINWLKTVLLYVCTLGLFLDQLFRVVMLFWR